MHRYSIFAVVGSEGVCFIYYSSRLYNSPLVYALHIKHGGKTNGLVSRGLDLSLTVGSAPAILYTRS